MARKLSSEQPRERRNKTVEINAVKHRKYKLYAARTGATIKELVEQAMDDLISKK